jgi:hypothetical protein
MSFRPKVDWGPYLWGFIHTITIIDLGCEENEKHNKNALDVLNGLQNCIPCLKCRDKYARQLELLQDLDLKEKLVLFRWSVDLHNEVNKKLNKKQISYETALETWSKTV